MNKFIIALAFVAVVGAVAYAEEIEDGDTQFGFNVNDVQETAHLRPEHQAFSQFCKDSRDEINSWTTTQLNKKAAEIFKTLTQAFAGAANEIGSSASQAAEEANGLVQKDYKMASSALKLVATGIAETSKYEALGAMEKFAQQMNGGTFFDMVRDACHAVSDDLRESLKESFQTEKQNILDSSESAEERAVIEKASLRTVNCLTTQRVNKVVLGCDLMKVVVPIVQNYMKNE